jgi:hypothetical protein
MTEVEYSINGRVLEYRTAEEEAQAVREEYRNNVVLSDRHRIIEFMDNEAERLWGRDMKRAIYSATHWDGFPHGHAKVQVAMSKLMYIASRDMDSAEFTNALRCVRELDSMSACYTDEQLDADPYFNWVLEGKTATEGAEIMEII